MGLAEAVTPFAFLLGSWSGAGTGVYPTIRPFRFAHELQVSEDGRPFLEVTSHTWIVDGEGRRVRAAATEHAFWRPQVGGAIEVVVAHATGIAGILAGHVEGKRVELEATRLAGTPTAKEVSAERRIYTVEGAELVFAQELGAVGQALQPHVTSRLARRAD
ncbi:MAG: FABP family protein [Candidatus Dormibacteraceae bacterium]